MRVAVLCNERAGRGTAPARIRAAIERQGHSVTTLVACVAGAGALLERPVDLVVAAGGDGTVAAAARAVRGRGTPLAVLPLGTANNIARSLNRLEPLDVLIDHWRRARVRYADMGVARGPWGERPFVESFGGGLVTSSIVAIDAAGIDSTSPPERRIEQAVSAFHQVLSRLTPSRWRLRMDGRRLEDDCLLVEVLNIRSVGPNFVVAPMADPFDGLFTVAVATESDREALASAVAPRRRSSPATWRRSAETAARRPASDSIHPTGRPPSDRPGRSGRATAGRA